MKIEFRIDNLKLQIAQLRRSIETRRESLNEYTHGSVSIISGGTLTIYNTSEIELMNKRDLIELQRLKEQLRLLMTFRRT